MLVRCSSVAVSFLVWGLTLGCGSTTTVSGPVDDAGCPRVVLDGGGVVDPPEGGAAECPSGICNYQTQAGCAAGQACRPQFTAASPDVSPGCEAAGSGLSGAACTAGPDCAAGYYCVENFCRKQCCAGDWLACNPGESCIRSLEVKVDGNVVDGGTIIDSGMSLCFPVNDCDPLDSKPCPNATDRECKIVDPTGAVACEPLSTAEIGDACESAGGPVVNPSTTCAAGLYCVAGKCNKLCRADACGEPACSAAEGTCVHRNRDPAGVGECTPL